VTETPSSETDDYIAITRLQNWYGDAVTRRAWDEFDAMFMPDAPVRVDTVTNAVIETVGGPAIATFIAQAVERFEFFEFVPLNTVIELSVDGDNDRAGGRLYICELRQDASNGQFSQAFGVYHDAYRRTAGGWRFAARNYQSLARTGRNEVFAFPQTAWP
jgi:hypothetical protein